MEEEKVTTVCSPRQDAGQRTVEARRRAWRGRRFTGVHLGRDNEQLSRRAWRNAPEETSCVHVCSCEKRSMLTCSRNKEVYHEEGI